MLMSRGFILFVLLFALLFSGCGMMGMQFTHGSKHNSGTMISTGDNTIIKELREDGYRFTLEIPPLFYGVEAGITLRLWDERTELPVTQAAVTVFIITGTVNRISPEAGEPGFDRGYQAIEIKKGNYRVTFLPDRIGRISFLTKIRLYDNARQLFVMKADQEIRRADMTEKTNNRFTPLAIMDGIGMIAMMALMWGWGDQ